MQQLQVSPTWFAWHHFMVISCTVKSTNCENQYWPHIGHKKTWSFSSHMLDKMNLKVYGAPTPIQSESQVFHTPSLILFMNMLFWYLVRVFTNQLSFIPTFSFFNEKISYRCYLMSGRGMLYGKLRFCAGWRWITWDSRSVLFFIDKCFLHCCYLGGHSLLFKIV